jgi:hypothetical protein
LNARLAVGSPIPTTEEPRLYSRQSKRPQDVVAPQHQEIHAELDSWGRWCRERYVPGECSSIEHNFDNREGGYREPKAPLITLPENPMRRKIDKVVRHMRMNMNAHGEALVLYYAGKLFEPKKPKAVRVGLIYIRCSPQQICRDLHLHWSHFEGHMTYSRAALVNLMRRMGE